MNKIKYKIEHLPKEKWKHAVVPMRYTTEEYYDLQVSEDEEGVHVDFIRSRFDRPSHHYPEEHNFPDKLYQDWWEKAYAWGIVGEDGELLACIETCPEEWSNRLMVTELWVHESLRRQGVGHELMAIAKRQAGIEHRRAIILETQSCNMPAIGFYRSEGFRLIGFDSCCYGNNDAERKEVRLDLGYFPRKNKLKKEDIIIRSENAQDEQTVEELALRAFWNKHQLGADEHFLIHKLRQSESYLPELSRVAEVDGKVVGAIFYSRASLRNEKRQKEILTFGPLCVDPEWQGCGVGGALLEETLKLAKEAGFEGVVIFGEPDYYPMHGFKTCDKFGITTADGQNFDPFMGIELAENGLSGMGGRFIEPKVFEELDPKECEEYTKRFDAPEMQKFPSQWK